MPKNMNTKLTKLIKYYSLINHNLIFSNKSINRYKTNKPVVERAKELEELREKIKNIKNCDLKIMHQIWYFQMENLMQK